jgi:hypothetical protein
MTRHTKYIILFFYLVVIFVCAWLASIRQPQSKELFQVNQLVVNPFYIPVDNTPQKQTCNVFSCNYVPPIRPPPPQPVEQPIVPEPEIVVQPSCPPEITIEDINDYDLYTPEEAMVEERIAEKQQQLNELEQKMQLTEMSFQQNQQIMDDAMRQQQGALQQTQFANTQANNTKNSSQDMMLDISKRLMLIQNKLGIQPL